MTRLIVLQRTSAAEAEGRLPKNLGIGRLCSASVIVCTNNEPGFNTNIFNNEPGFNTNILITTVLFYFFFFWKTQIQCTKFKSTKFEQQHTKFEKQWTRFEYQ